MSLLIRSIQAKDNPEMASIICDTLAELGFTGEGWASSDAETFRMFESYQADDCHYWVIEDTATQTIVGGCGFSRLKQTQPAEGICELQKLYFRPKLRGQGWAPKLIQHCIDGASELGYLMMYLETGDLQSNARAVSIYTRLGFEFIEGHLGNTGHQEKCRVFMTRRL
jgi:putative acetyltransferase